MTAKLAELTAEHVLGWKRYGYSRQYWVDS
jgi:hypothetical protein